MVDYGTTTSYDNHVVDSTLALQHTITLTGLTPLTTYHFQVVTSNADDLTVKYSDITFTTPEFSASSIADVGTITVMVADGNFNSDNSQAREAIATEYFKTHSDVDFLVNLSTFDYALPSAGAEGFYTPVKNDVAGIDQMNFNYTAQFGSAGKLQGTIDVGNIATLHTDLTGQQFNDKVRLLAHELMHRFGAYALFKSPEGFYLYDLLGKDNAHWSYLLDTGGSLMYGSGWKDNGNGTFTATEVRNSYSPLDLYLMGMIPKEQVPPMTLIQNIDVSKYQMPQLGTTISGTAKIVTITDIIAATGARSPDYTTSQKQFTIGFVLLSRAGDDTAKAVQTAEQLRSAFAGRLVELTRGKGSIADVAASIAVQVDSPSDNATITGPDVTVQGTIINSTGAETGVTVNGVPATITDNHYIANHVLLQQGSNSITITATDANGLTTTATKSITAQAGNYIRISSNIDSGTGPLNISLRLDGSFPISKPQISVHGPVGVQVQQDAQTGAYSATLPITGSYAITAAAQGPDGQTYTDSVTVTVVSRAQLEALLKGKWEGMKAKIAAGDVEGAILDFSSSAKNDYREAFTAAGTSLSLLNTYLKPIELIYSSSNRAKFRMMRQEAVMGQVEDVEYVIYFVKENGIWKLKKL